MSKPQLKTSTSASISASTDVGSSVPTDVRKCASTDVGSSAESGANNKFELVKVVSNEITRSKEGITEIYKDKNGLIATKSIELRNNNQMVERVKLTMESFHKALVENITSSDIALIDQIISAVVADAQAQAASESSRHFSNRLIELSNAVGTYKQQNIETQKQFSIEETTSSVWDIPIDIYNLTGNENNFGSHDKNIVINDNISSNNNEEQSFDI